MDKFIRIFFILVLTCLFSLRVSAQEYRVLVLPDNIQFENTNYYVYPDTSVIFASDTINELKKGAKIETVSMTEVRDALRKNVKLYLLTKNALKEFKYNYNIPFVDFRAIATRFGTDKVLVITSQTDVQNYVLRRTLWDFLNIPGASVVDPAYKMSTYAALIDVNKEEVLWQGTFYKKLATVENRMLAQSFAPATEQLEKIKLYSQYYLSPEISRIVQGKILPPTLPNSQTGVVDVSDIKTETQKINLPEQNLEFLQKIPLPKREGSQEFGEIINEL